MEKPTFKQKIDGFCTFLYNSETGQLLGRGAKSWAEIGIFYLIYYICLSAFFAATMAVFYQTMDKERPKLQGTDSLLKGNPGLGYQPMPDIDATLVRVSKDTWKENKKAIDDVLNAYDNKENADCSSMTGLREGNDGKKACKVEIAKLKEFCNEKNAYGYNGTNPQPCILLKLNRIFGWKPKPYDKQPEDLHLSGSAYSADKIWIQCEGENAADKEKMGKVTYFPQQGFPLSYYPFSKQDNYLSPIVMVKFEKPVHEMGMMILCKAYAENIELNPQEKEGSVQFELLVEHPQS